MPLADQQLTDELYRDLLRCANRILARQSRGVTLQPTEMVNEVCARILEADNEFEDSVHAYRCAAKAMRNLLIDHVRAKSSLKKGGHLKKTVWVDEMLANTDEVEGMLVIDKTFDEMATISDRLESIAELHYFAGFTQKRIAEITSLGLATVERELKFARTFLTDRLQRI